MKRILVTGGFGFIGSSLVHHLLQDTNNWVHVVDNMSTSTLDITDYVNHNVDQQRFSYDVMSVDEYFKDHHYLMFLPDEIYHLASPVGAASVIHKGGTMIKEVVQDIYTIMDYALNEDSDVRIVDVSTSEVYGGGDQNGFCSEYTPKIFGEFDMRMEYAVAKFAAETAIVNTCATRGLNASIVRPFNVAGKRQSAQLGFVIPRFVQQAKAGIPYTVFNDGRDIRAFTHVDDICEVLQLVMSDGKSGRVYNIGNPNNKTTIDDLWKRINKVLHIDNEAEYIKGSKVFGKHYRDVPDKYPDATIAMKELGWKPERNISTIIKDYVREFDRQKQQGILKDEI